MIRTAFSIVLFVFWMIPTLGLAQDPPQFSYKYFKADIPLELDTSQIAVFDESGGTALRALLDQRGLAVRMELTDGWSILDLSGSPSGGDPVLVVGLIQAIAQDPTSTLFAAPVFIGGDNISMLTGRTVNMRFNEGVPLSVVEMELQSVGLGSIVEENWQGRPNLFRVAAGSRSGIDMLEAANMLAPIADIVYAHPAFLMFGDGLVDSEPETAANPLRSPQAIAGNTDPVSARRLALTSKEGPVCPALVNPGDPNLSDSWGLEQASDIDVDATGAWLQCSGVADIPVALFDDGVESHPDLPNVLLGGDFTGQCNGFPCAGEPQSDCDNHGTTTAGVLAASAANAEGSVGMAPNITIISIRVGSYIFTGGRCVPQIETADVTDGISRAVALGARITVLPWNWERARPMADVEDAYKTAYQAGVVHFNSAGNLGEARVRAPGNIPEVNSISGINSVGDLFVKRPGFASNFGPNVAFAAPGRSIFTTDRIDDRGFVTTGQGSFGDVYVLMTGTSYAVPHVAGIAALILSCRPDLTPRDVEFILRITAVDRGAPGWDVEYGHGLVNAEGSVTTAVALISQCGFEDGDTCELSIGEPVQ